MLEKLNKEFIEDLILIDGLRRRDPLDNAVWLPPWVADPKNDIDRLEVSISIEQINEFIKRGGDLLEARKALHELVRESEDIVVKFKDELKPIRIRRGTIEVLEVLMHIKERIESGELITHIRIPNSKNKFENASRYLSRTRRWVKINRKLIVGIIDEILTLYNQRRNK